MATGKQHTYRLLPEWRLHQNSALLTISGGADAQYEVELVNDEPSFFASLQPGTYFDRSQLNEADQRVLEELQTAEIVVPHLKVSKTLRVRILGTNTKLLPVHHKNITITTATQSYDLALVVRTSGTYAELLTQLGYQDIAKPHLFVDLAFHHTLSIGPLVFPGETACIACLQGRIGSRWGDETPPNTPRMASQYSGVATELISSELARIADGDMSLANKTISWNFKDRAVKQEQLLKVPLCPVCAQNRIDHTGSLALPW